MVSAAIARGPADIGAPIHTNHADILEQQDIGLQRWNAAAGEANHNKIAAIRQAAEKRISMRRTAPHKLTDFVGGAAKVSKWD